MILRLDQNSPKYKAPSVKRCLSPDQVIHLRFDDSLAWRRPVNPDNANKVTFWIIAGAMAVFSVVMMLP